MHMYTVDCAAQSRDCTTDVGDHVGTVLNDVRRRIALSRRICAAWKCAKIPTWLCGSQAWTYRYAVKFHCGLESSDYLGIYVTARALYPMESLDLAAGTFRMKTGAQSRPDTSSLVSMRLLLVHVFFTNRGRLTSRYYNVPKRPLAFNVSCIYCHTHSNNDYRRDICFCVAWLNLQTSERLRFGANFLCRFERFSSLNLDIVDFTGKFHARATMILTTVPTRSYEAIK